MGPWTIVGAAVAGLLLVLFAWGLFLHREFRFEFAAEIPAPPRQVWRTLSEPSLVPKWEALFARVETEGPPGRGQRWRLHKRSGRGPGFEVVVVAWDPPRGLSFEGEKPFHGRRDWTLEAAGAGTRLRLVETVTLPNPILRVPMSLFAKSFRRTMEGSLVRLGEVAAGR